MKEENVSALVEQVIKNKQYAPKGQVAFYQVPEGAEIKCDITQEVIPAGEIYYIIYGVYDNYPNITRKLFISKDGKDILERADNGS